MSSHVVFSCAHVLPDSDLSRFTYLGQMIADLRPEHVVCVGDFADMQSLYHNRRIVKNAPPLAYAKDLDETETALDMIMEPIRKRKKKLPKFWITLGNHEQRIVKAGEEIEDLPFAGNGWEVVAYDGETPGCVRLDGITYCHYLPNSNGTARSGSNLAADLLDSSLSSITVGHSHNLDYSTRVGANGKRAHGLVVGCYHDNAPSWAGRCSDQWWRGVAFKSNIDEGDYNLSLTSLAALREMYE